MPIVSYSTGWINAFGMCFDVPGFVVVNLGGSG